jgi:hypothetical protein
LEPAGAVDSMANIRFTAASVRDSLSSRWTGREQADEHRQVSDCFLDLPMGVQKCALVQLHPSEHERAKSTRPCRGEVGAGQLAGSSRVLVRAGDRRWPAPARGGGELTPTAAPSSDPRWDEVEQHRPTALRLLLRTFPGLRGQHEDIWQEVATALFTRSKEQGFWPNELRNYLLGAVGKNAANRLRTARLQNTHASDPQSGELARLAAAPVDEQVIGELDAENYRSIIRSLNPRQRAVAAAERDVHQGTLRAQRLPEHPPALRKALAGRGNDRLTPEQVSSLLPSAFLRASA